MKIETEVVLKNLDGEELKDASVKGESTNVTLKICLINALLSPLGQGKTEAGTEKLKKFNLAKKINDNKEVDLSADDIVLLKNRVGEVYPPLIVGQVYELLGENT